MDSPVQVGQGNKAGADPRLQIGLRRPPHAPSPSPNAGAREWWSAAAADRPPLPLSIGADRFLSLPIGKRFREVRPPTWADRFLSPPMLLLRERRVNAGGPRAGGGGPRSGRPGRA